MIALQRGLLLCCLSLLLHPAVAQDFALAQLEDSPRHHEWAEIDVEGRTLHAFIAFPERAEPTGAVVIIHENRGLTDWVRSFADQVAALGYVALAPDLLSSFDADHDVTADFADSDAARTALYQLDPNQITADLEAALDHLEALPAVDGPIAVMGFCWGGSQTFRFATDNDAIAAAMVFYGSPPDAEALNTIEAPIYGFYGENDQRINATIPNTEKAMGRLSKTYDYVIYPGAGHAFMRRGDDPTAAAEDPANYAARNAAWGRLETLLATLQED